MLFKSHAVQWFGRPWRHDAPIRSAANSATSAINKTNPPNVKGFAAENSKELTPQQPVQQHGAGNPTPTSRSTSATTSRVTPGARRPKRNANSDLFRAAPSSRRALHQDQGGFGYSLSLTELALCYSYFVLWKKGVRASQAKTPHGLGVWPETAIRFSPPQTFLFDPEAALVALAGRPVIGRVSPCSSSASIPDSNAD
ncbi:MAG: hypothetical protein QOJ42_2925 [Acidobacteriaceae bacterium]|nr:hypothetical protein [Acidobacteriaceae bacterium]